MGGEVIDARGLKCPWPALRLARALREGRGPTIEILADDPDAERELAAVAAAAAARCARVGQNRFRIER